MRSALPGTKRIGCARPLLDVLAIVHPSGKTNNFKCSLKKVTSMLKHATTTSTSSPLRQSNRQSTSPDKSVTAQSTV